MRRTEISLSIILFLLISFTCKEEFAERDFPSVITNEIIIKGTQGIEFSGDLIIRGSAVPEEIGFIWQNGSDPGMDPGYRISLPGISNSGKFSVLVKTSLKKNSEYYVRAYARRGNTMIYGDLFRFISPADFVPGITSVSPMTAHVGDTVTIKGETFNTSTSKYIVRFNSLEAEIVFSNDSIIKCIVPLSLIVKESTISVIDEGPANIFPEKFQLITPTISSVSPVVSFFRDTISITGTGFHKNKQFNSVKIGNINVGIITNSPVKLTVIAPYSIDTMCFVSVSVSGQTATTNEKIKVRIPEFDLFEPLSANYLDTITIYCRNLRVGDITSIQFDNVNAKIISSGANSITVEVPTNLRKENSDVKLYFASGEYIFNNKFHLNQPVITGVSPARVFNQELLTISGSGFNPVKTGNRVNLVNVQFGTVYSFIPVTSSSSSIQIKIQNPSNPALSLPSGQYNLSVGTCEGNFAWGSQIEVADHWRKLSNFPGGGRYKGGAFVINGKGYAGMGTKPGNDIQKDLWEFNPVTETWTRKADFPGYARILPCVFTNNNYGFFGGGQSLDNYASQIPYTDFYKYNPVLNTWSMVANAPSVQKSFPGSYASTSSNIHVANLTIGIMLKYTEETDTWSQIYTGGPSVYSGPSTFSINNKVYFVGGIDSQGNNITSNCVWEYDTETSTMTRKNDFPGDPIWAGFGFAIGNNGYIGCGEIVTSGGIRRYLTDMYKYDPMNDTWTQIASFPGGILIGESSFVIGGKAYIVFGHNGASFSSDVWEFWPE